MYQINYIATELQKDTSLSLSARCVLGRIGGLTQKGNKACYASNEFLASECGLSEKTAQRALNELLQRKIIDTKVTLYQGKKTRYIYLVYEPQNNNSEQDNLTLSNKDNLTLSNKDNLTLSNKDILSEVRDNLTLSNKDNLSEVRDNLTLSNKDNLTFSSIYREKDSRARIEKDTRDRVERDRKTHSLSLDFDSIFSAMNKLKTEFNDHVFTESEIRENAQTYLDKSQAYKVYQGEVTEKKLMAWLQSSIKYQQKKSQGSKKSYDNSIEYDFEGASERIRRFKQLEEQYDREHSKPIDADCEIIEENKNALV